ncbi:hypothetical protein FEM48_Zijuj11G0056300 [Ziziphus jujuba var. spinosa]|uniref:Flavin-containing monooxygenase n=1 Tax=Ziziphus jujuba var. spinosa TaxID=714518 RepID=A0A978UH50_ZIZJJ|nr:hypothetical protein FEM48_Zijuj11G0056300 [Ziziphus jujuba var. spinosa]
MTNLAATLQHVSLPPTTLHPLASRHVAVIGAGASGLVAARELRREGHRVVVFEQGDQVGGTWVYTPKIESDPLGVDPRRTVVQSSLYQSLRTNLPREVMGFRDFPFVPRKDDKERDSRRFPGHREVLMYLEDFASEFGIVELVRLETEVMFVGMVDGGKWQVRSKKRDGICLDEIYDAVVVCNGHYTEPRVADDIPGNYFLDFPCAVISELDKLQVVILIGSAASAADISRELAGVAKEVHVASRSVGDGATGKRPDYDNLWLHSMIKSVHEDSSVVFKDGSAVLADVILHCTGYKYHFPFLETNGIVMVDDNCVGPLYKHVFPPALAPWLSFIGLPWKVVPFPLFEFQSKWIAGLLSNRLALPHKEQMMEDVEAFYSILESSGIPKRYTHNMADYQFEYDDWLAEASGSPGSEIWRKEMYNEAWKNKRVRPETYRDDWEDDHLVLQAYEDFKQILK